MNSLNAVSRSWSQRIVVWSIAAVVALCALTLSQAPSFAATPTDQRGAAVLRGQWVGSNTGYENGVYVKRELRLTITKTRGSAFSGTKGWRDLGATTWEGPEPIQGILLPNGEIHAADADGIMVGTLVSPKEFHLVYTEVGGDGSAFLQKLVKQKAGG